MRIRMAQVFPNGTDLDYSIDMLRFTHAATWTLVTIPLWATTITIIPLVTTIVAIETTNGDGGAVAAGDDYISLLAGSSLEIAVSKKNLPTSVSAIFIAGNPGVGEVGLIAEAARR